EAGVSLSTFCDQARVPISGRIELFSQFAQAVSHAHGRSVIHGSIGPNKLRCEERPEGVRFLVLGIGAPPGTGSAADVIAGCYLAPENWADAGAPDMLGDVYALGAILYELLVGV